MSSLGELRWTFLETFAKVTRACEDLQERVLNSSITRQVLPEPNPIHSPQPNRMYNNPSHGLDEITRLYLTRWAAGIVDRSGFELPSAITNSLTRMNHSYDPNFSTGQTSPLSEGMFDTEVGSFELLQDSSKPEKIDILCLSREPLSPMEWIQFYTNYTNSQSLIDNQICNSLQLDSKSIMKRIFSGGMEHDIRPEVWKYMLNFYPWNTTEQERKLIYEQKKDGYWKLKAKWMDPAVKETDEFKEQHFRIEKDVLRTDRHLPLFAPQESEINEQRALPPSNASIEQLKDILLCYHYHSPSLGYVQGMSDLLSPIFAVMQDEVETFWCFVVFMERMKGNFGRDQKQMHQQLQTIKLLCKLLIPNLYLHLVNIDADNMFICFRWVLIWFKREFEFDHILRIWEVIWTDHLTEHFHLFIVMGILDMHQHVIITHLHALEEALRYTNELAYGMDYRVILRRGEHLFHQFQSYMKFTTNFQPDSENELHTPLLLTPPPEIHSYTVTPCSPDSRPSQIILTQEELASLTYLLL